MTKKKSNPVMSPEWLASLLEDDVISFPIDDSHTFTDSEVAELVKDAKTAFGVSRVFGDPPQRASNEQLGPPPKLHPRLQELLDNCLTTLDSMTADEQSTAAPPSPVDPGLLLGIRFVLDDAVEALDAVTNRVADAQRSISTAVENIDEIEEDMKRWNIATDMPINEEVQDLYGGGGQTLESIKLSDMYYTIKRMLDANSITNREVVEFTDAIERLMWK